MESWRKVWREGVEPLLSTQALEVLRCGLASDDPRLQQDVNDAVEEAEGLGIRGVPALVIGGEWLMQGCRELSEYRQVIDKYLRERVASAQVRVMH